MQLTEQWKAHRDDQVAHDNIFDGGFGLFGLPLEKERGQPGRSKKQEHKEIQMAPSIEVIDGDLLEQDVDVIVNAWNRNIIPWWLLIPQGVSGAIKKRGGYAPFRELAKKGPIPLGNAVITGSGRLPQQAIIHVAGISMLWISSERSIRDSAKNAVRLAQTEGYESIAMPLIGAGTGGTREQRVLDWMLDELEQMKPTIDVKIVRFRPKR